MNVAIVVDDLIQRGGQELLLTAVSEMFPKAKIYTLQVSDYWLDFYKKRGVNVVTSFMQKLPFALKLNRYFAPFLFHILAFERFDFSDYDVVISVSSRFAHFINTKPKTKHICYMNSPGRMFWEPEDYFKNESFGFLKPIRFFAKYFLSLPLSYTRELDFVAAQKIDLLIANSINSQKRISKYYRRDSQVIYPFFDLGNQAARHVSVQEDYFVLLTRLVSWKKVDIAVKACTDLKINLKIIGEGPDKARLQKMAGATVKFLGRADKEKVEVLAGAKALIQTQFEDFGIVPLEAMSQGIPVIAYGAGGVLETVLPGVTGEFFYKQDPFELARVIHAFLPQKYDRQKCIDRANLFSKQNFKQQLLSTIHRFIV